MERLRKEPENAHRIQKKGAIMIQPRHLEKIYDPTDDEGTEGEIVCECGGRAFKIRCFGEFYDKNKMAVRE